MKKGRSKQEEAEAAIRVKKTQLNSVPEASRDISWYRIMGMITFTIDRFREEPRSVGTCAICDEDIPESRFGLVPWNPTCAGACQVQWQSQNPCSTSHNKKRRQGGGVEELVTA